LQAAADAVPASLWMAAPDGTITYANQPWFRYTGLSAERCSRRWPELLLHPEDLERCTRAWRDVVTRGVPCETEARHRRHDGIYRWFLTCAAPIRDAGGRVGGWVGLATDIHDRKHAEAHARRSEEALRIANRRKDDFLAMLAHELRNPLAPLRTAVELLRTADHPGVIEKVLPVCERQLGLMVRLVDDLLDISRITRGKIELRKETVDLAGVVGRAVESSRPLIAARGHRLELAMPGGPVILHADATRLEQVLMNLLNNAAKFTPMGGRIAVRLEVSPEGREARICVTDNGVGIPPHALPRVFDMFVQAEGGLERAEGGLGIGLSLVRGLVELHGGRVEASSAGPGQGSEFIVHLPLSPANAPTRLEVVSPPEPTTGERTRGAQSEGRRKILVVDDNVDAAESLAEYLAAAGHELRVAHDGPRCLELAREEKPDVIIMDIGMPGMSGYDVARRLRDDPELGALLLVALSGWGQDEAQRKSREAGFDHHVVKPADLTTLERLIAASPRRS
jgi:two-component system CheB/CheR fusion protein